MANAAGDSHEIVIYGAHFRVTFPALDADGDLVTGMSTPDTEVSQDGGTFADASTEATELATSSGVYYVDLIGTETDCKQCAVIVKSATAGMKTTTLVLYPERLCILASGTAQAGGASTITLAAATSLQDNDLAGLYVFISNNSPAGAQYQVRKIISNVASTQVATVDSAWGTNPSNASTYDLLCRMTVNVPAWGGTKIPTLGTAGVPDVNTVKVGGGTTPSGSIPNAVAGASGGLVIAGSNAATTFAGLTTGALACTTITASGAVAFQSTFAVTTSTSLAALSCSTLTASGAVAFQSTFAVSTSTALGALSCTTLTASGAVAFQSTFIVTTSTALGALSCSTFGTSGTVTFNAFTVTNAMTVSGTTTHTGAVSFGSTFGVTGLTTLAGLTTGALSCSTITASGAVAFQSTFAVTTSTALAALSCSTLTASGAVAFQSTFATTGTTTLNALTVTNATTLSGAVSLGSTLGITGTTTLAALTTTGTTTFNALTVTNATTLSGAVSLGSTLGVTGTTTLAALTTTGTTTLNALTVTNATTLNTLGVSGATTFTGSVVAANGANNIVGIDVAKISGDATAADNAELFFDGTGYAGTNNVIPLVTTTTTATNLTNAPTNGDLTAAMKASVNAEVVDCLNVDTYAEVGQETPAATNTLRKMISYLFKSWRNKKTQTATTYSLFADDASTVDQKSAVSDDGTTTTVGEVATGP